MADCERSASTARAAATAAVAVLLVGTWVGTLVPLSPAEPLLDVRGGDARCVRSHWSRTHSTGFNWELTARVTAGNPARTLALHTRLDVSATAALQAQAGLSAAQAEQVVQSTRSAAFAGVVVLATDAVLGGLANSILQTSETLMHCQTPIAGIALSACDESVYLSSGDPNRRPSALNGRHALRVLVVSRDLLGPSAQLNNADGELFLDDGVSSDGAVTVGAVTTCVFNDPPAVDVSLRGDESVAYEASRDATGALVATRTSGAARCGAAASVPLFLDSSAHAILTQGNRFGIGFADAKAYNAAVCGVGHATDANSTSVVLGCASGAAQCSGAPVVPLADASRRPLQIEWTGGAYAIKTIRRQSSAFNSAPELTVAILRLTCLLLVSILTERRARHGASGHSIYEIAIRWSSGVELVPLRPPQESSDASKAAPEADSPDGNDSLSPLAVLALRVAQFGLVYATRSANHMGLILALDGLSIATSLGLWVLRATTPCANHAQQVAVHGGSPWLLDAQLTILSLACHLPLQESLEAHGWSSLARVAVGLLLISQALPRCILSLASAVALAKSANFFASMRYASWLASGLWAGHIATSSVLVGSILVRPVLYASSDQFSSFELAASLTLLPISAWYLFAVYQGLRAPCV